jgi:hypothetical protein
MPEMNSTKFRTDLTEIVDNLAVTGPVRVTRNSGGVVAEIRAATPAAEVAYVEEILEAVRLLDRINITDDLFRLGLGTLGDMIELARRYRELTSEGVELGDGNCCILPEHGPLTVDHILAHLYFRSSAPSAGDIREWFQVCVRLQNEARARDLSANLFDGPSYEGSNIAEVAVEAGHTPESFAALALQALNDGVGLDRLSGLFDERAVPADVLALPHYAEYQFDELTEAGLPHVEAIAFFRLDLDYKLALGFVNAGVRVAEEIKVLIDNKVDISLAQRAARDGIPLEQWRIQVPRLQQLRYRGDGVLPFAVLIQAADEKVSVTRWDNNKLAVASDRWTRGVTATRSARLLSYPWSSVYPDRVIDLARAGVSPSFIAAFGKLTARHTYNTDAEFADTAIIAYEKGLTIDVAKAISRADAKAGPKFTPEHLFAILDEGLRDPATAHYLADRYSKHTEWIDDIRERKNRQATTDEFLSTIMNTPSWDAVRAVAFSLISVDWLKRQMRGKVYTNAAIDRLLGDEQLDDRQVITLLNLTRSRLKNDLSLPNEIRETYAPQIGEIEDLMKLFFDMLKPPEPEEEPEGDPEQSFITAVAHLANNENEE